MRSFCVRFHCPALYLRARVSLLGLAAVLSLASVVIAQDPTPPAKPPAAPAAKDAGGAWEKLLYIPYRSFKAVLEKPEGTVFLPYRKYLELWEQAQAGQPPQPVAAVISKAAYDGRVENQLARLDATYTIQVLTEPWAEIPLRFGDAAVGKMTASDDKVVLRGAGEGTYSLLFPAKGTFTVELELVSRVRTSTEGRGFELDVPAVGITTLNMTIPAPDQTVEVTPHLVSVPVEADANSTKIQASVGSTQRLAARWYPRVGKTPEMELLTTVQNQLSVRVADGLLHADAVLTYQVLRGQLSQVKVAVPLGHRILDVSAPNLKGWKAVAEANRQVVTVDLLGDESKSVPIEIHTEAPAPEGTFDAAGIEQDGKVHGIHSLDVIRESGLLVVGHGPELTLAVEQQQGLTRIEAGEAPESVRRPDHLYYKFYSPDFRLQVSAQAVEPRIQVDHATRLEFHDDELRLNSELQYTIERAGVFELRFKLPADLKIDSVDCEQKKEFAVSGDSLVLTLTQKTQGEMHVTIRGRMPLDSDNDENELSLPVIEPLGVAREQGTLRVYAPEALEVITDEESLVAAQPDRSPNAEAIPQLRLASAWTYNRRPVEIQVTTVRKPTRLTADVATTIDVKQELVEIASRLNYLVEYAGLDTFRFAVPEAIADRVQIETVGGAAIKQRSRTPAEKGWVTWTVTLQREITGPQALRVTYDLKPEPGQAGANVLIEPVRVLGVPGEEAGAADKVPLSRASGEIAVLKERALSITGEPKDLEPIDVRELTRLPQAGYLAYRYFKQPVSLRLGVVRNQIQEVIETVVSKALVEAVVSHEETITYRVRYLLKTSERQRLPLQLPNDSQVLGGMVAGKQVSQLEKGDDANTYYVNVTRSGTADQPFYITLLFRAKSRPLSRSHLGGTVDLPLPRLGDTASADGIAVQQLRVVVWVPEEYSLVGTPDHFTPERTLTFNRALRGRTCAVKNTQEAESWIGDPGGTLFDFSTTGHAFEYRNLGGTTVLAVTWWRASWVTYLLSGAVLLIALVISGTTWENKLGLLLIGAFALLLWSLTDPDTAVQVAAATRFGVVFGLVYWIIQGLSKYKAWFLASSPAPVVVPVSTTWEAEMGPAHAAVIPPPGVFDDLRRSLRPPQSNP